MDVARGEGDRALRRRSQYVCDLQWLNPVGECSGTPEVDPSALCL